MMEVNENKIFKNDTKWIQNSLLMEVRVNKCQKKD